MLVARPGTDAARRGRRRGDQQGGRQGRGPGPRRRPVRTRWPPRRCGWSPGAARRHRAHPPRPDDGGRRGRRLQRRTRPRGAPAGRPRRLCPRHPAAAGRAHRAHGRRPRHRHRRPGLAGRADRHRRRGRGSRVLERLDGRFDAHGNPLVVTAPAVADEIAGLAELAQGKLGGRPFAVVRGRADLVLPAGDDGPGAAALVRPDGADMFGSAPARPCSRRCAGEAGAPVFGRPAAAEEVAERHRGVLWRPSAGRRRGPRRGRRRRRAHGAGRSRWRRTPTAGRSRRRVRRRRRSPTFPPLT